MKSFLQIQHSCVILCLSIIRRSVSAHRLATYHGLHQKTSFVSIARLTQGTPAHDALHCQVALSSGRSLGRDGMWPRSWCLGAVSPRLKLQTPRSSLGLETERFGLGLGLHTEGLAQWDRRNRLRLSKSGPRAEIGGQSTIPSLFIFIRFLRFGRIFRIYFFYFFGRSGRTVVYTAHHAPVMVQGKEE